MFRTPSQHRWLLGVAHQRFAQDLLCELDQVQLAPCPRRPLPGLRAGEDVLVVNLPADLAVALGVPDLEVEGLLSSGPAPPGTP